MKMKLPRMMQLVWLMIGFIIIIGCSKNETKVPVVVTEPLTSVTTTSAMGAGMVIDDGGASILARGICWSENPLPTVSDGNASAGSGMGTFTVNLTGLTANTKYYVRTYATNEVGTGYSDQLVLQTMFGTVTDVDGNIYQTVRIGNQEWMAENLKVTHYNNSGAIPNITDYNQWPGVSTGAYCWYANDYEALGKYYGALYNWFALEDPRNLCPSGWHVPSIEEWDSLFTELGGADYAGGKLKSNLTALFQHPYWVPPNYLGTNESGFSAFPGGFRSYLGGVFSGLGFSGYWWSTTPDSLNIKGIWLNTSSPSAYQEGFNKNSGASVRCIRD